MELIEDACAYEKRAEELDFLLKAPTESRAPYAWINELYLPALDALVRCGILEQVLHGQNYQYNPNMHKISKVSTAFVNNTLDVRTHQPSLYCR